MKETFEDFLMRLTERELLDYRQLVEILYNFYDNEMKANIGAYDSEHEIIYKNASREATKYLAAKEKVFNEIKRRVDEAL